MFGRKPAAPGNSPEALTIKEGKIEDIKQKAKKFLKILFLVGLLGGATSYAFGQEVEGAPKVPENNPEGRKEVVEDVQAKLQKYGYFEDPDGFRETQETEKGIYKEQLVKEGKSVEIAEKIIEAKFRTFYWGQDHNKITDDCGKIISNGKDLLGLKKVDVPRDTAEPLSETNHKRNMIFFLDKDSDGTLDDLGVIEDENRAGWGATEFFTQENVQSGTGNANSINKFVAETSWTHDDEPKKMVDWLSGGLVPVQNAIEEAGRNFSKESEGRKDYDKKWLERKGVDSVDVAQINSAYLKFLEKAGQELGKRGAQVEREKKAGVDSIIEKAGK